MLATLTVFSIFLAVSTSILSIYLLKKLRVAQELNKKYLSRVDEYCQLLDEACLYADAYQEICNLIQDRNLRNL